jgi:hypothetical protein
MNKNVDISINNALNELKVKLQAVDIYNNVYQVFPEDKSSLFTIGLIGDVYGKFNPIKLEEDK